MKDDLISRSALLEHRLAIPDEDSACVLVTDILRAPAVDLIHCGECIHYKKPSCAMSGVYYAISKETGFCNFGRRRPDNGTDH